MVAGLTLKKAAQTTVESQSARYYTLPGSSEGCEEEGEAKQEKEEGEKEEASEDAATNSNRIRNRNRNRS